VNRQGFTVIELVLVLLIIAVLVWIGVPAYQGYIARSRIVDAISTVSRISTDIHDYEVRTGALPASLADVNYATTLDPWGRNYVYLDLRLTHGAGARKDKSLKPLNSDFDLYSVGPDGLTTASLNNAVSRDDVLRARDGGFYGTAEEFDP
jgi:general secretion pathway protein G